MRWRWPRSRDCTTAPRAAAMQIVFYNPLNAAAMDRLEQISREFRRHEAVALLGTGERRDGEEVVRATLRHHVALRFGWKVSGRSVNKSCGITLLLKPKWVDSVVSILEPPPASGLRGRVAAVRVRTKVDDVLLVMAYAPPYGGLLED